MILPQADHAIILIAAASLLPKPKCLRNQPRRHDRAVRHKRGHLVRSRDQRNHRRIRKVGLIGSYTDYNGRL
jgi:hypothetical protein